MSTTKLVTMICWIVVAVVMIGLVIWFLTGSLFGIRTGFKINTPVFNIGSFDNLTGPYNEVGSYTVTAESVKSIDVKWVSGAVSVTPYDGDVIKITEYARRSLKDEEKLTYDVDGSGKLVVQYTKPGINMNMVTKKVELLVPKSIANELNQLNVNAVSADLKISDFSVKSFGINETSGESVVSNIKSDNAEVHSVSGEITLTNMTASRLTLGAVSGEIKLDGVTADFVKANTTSGEQFLGGAFKSVDASSVSGEIFVTSSVTPGSMNCGSTSGSITVTIPSGSDLSVSYHTTSGHFHSSIPVKTGGSADYRFSSVSGDIWLKAA
jgi:DUF4097 and DUF4098 domain-containing protein YvlB